MNNAEKQANRQTFHFCCMLTDIEDNIQEVKNHYKLTGDEKCISTLIKLQNNYRQISKHVDSLTKYQPTLI